MTLVRVDLREPTPTGPQPAAGHISARPYRRRHHDTPEGTAGDHVLLPVAFTVELVEGVATLELAPTSGAEAWLILERVAGGTTRLVAVPDTETTLDYGDLTDLDPATLDPASTPPSWGALEARIAALEAEEGAGGGGADAATLEALEGRVTQLEEEAEAYALQLKGHLDAITGLNTRLTALENAPDEDGTGYATAAGRWQINPQAGAIPGGRQITCDTGNFADAAWLRFTTTDDNNNDMTTPLLACTTIYGQQQADSSNWARWKVTGAASEGPGYVEVPVALVNSSGAIAAAQWQAGSFLLGVPVAPAVQ